MSKMKRAQKFIGKKIRYNDFGRGFYYVVNGVEIVSRTAFDRGDVRIDGDAVWRGRLTGRTKGWLAFRVRMFDKAGQYVPTYVNKDVPRYLAVNSRVRYEVIE